MEFSPMQYPVEYDSSWSGFKFLNRIEFDFRSCDENQIQELLDLIKSIFFLNIAAIYKLEHDGDFYLLERNLINNIRLENIEVWNQFQTVVTSSFPRKLTYSAVKFFTDGLDVYGQNNIVAYPLKYNRKILGVIVLGGTPNGNPISFEGMDPKIIKYILDIMSMGLHRLDKGHDFIDSSTLTLNKLTHDLSDHDTYTSVHSNKTAHLSEKIAKLMGCTDQEIQLLRWGSVLHDVGKIFIPKNILNKPDKLNETEWNLMKLHPEIGSRIVELTTGLTSVAEIVLTHHEHFDGRGYPKQLSGRQIPLVSRILSVVDAYGAMTENRVYQKAKPSGAALQELLKCAGTHFDPDVVDQFFKILTTRNLIFENTV